MAATFEVRKLDAPLGADVFGFPSGGYSPQDLVHRTAVRGESPAFRHAA